MPKPLELTLDDEMERPELEKIRDHHPKPYVRERAAAILKIADHMSGREVALHGLLKPRCPDSIYDWVKDYRSEGVKGLVIKPGRGRKPAFSPSVPGQR
jgi:transposase